MIRSLVAAALIAMPAAPFGPPGVGRPAPDFLATDSNGARVQLADLKGKIVVLEWTNDGCPFVGKWYRSGAMQALQREAAGLGAVWLSVVSSAPGEQGYVDGAAANRDTAERNAAPAHVLLDPTGAIGHLYGAETTPDIFVIRADGTLAYRGGADSIPSTRTEDLARVEPYAREALEAVAKGETVPHPVTRPYGCGVKFAS